MSTSQRMARQQWDDAELETLFTLRSRGASWQQIADRLPERTADAVRNEFHRLTKQGMLPIQQLPATPDAEPFAEATRNRTTWTKEEDIKLLSGLHTHGKQWRRILAQFPGRSDSSVRNRAKRLLGSAASMLGSGKSESGKSDSDAESSPRTKASPRSVEASPRALAPPRAPPRSVSSDDNRRERADATVERRSRSERRDDTASLSDSLRAMGLFDSERLFEMFSERAEPPAGAGGADEAQVSLDELSANSTGSLDETLDNISLDELASITASLQEDAPAPLPIQ